MTTHLLDTSAAIALVQDVPPVLAIAEPLIADGLMAISTCSVGELFFGVYASAYPEQERAAIEELLWPLQIIQFDEAAAREYGRVQAALRRIGRAITSIDAQIAAIALVRDLTVVSADKHFTYVENLRVENWLAET